MLYRKQGKLSSMSIGIEAIKLLKKGTSSTLMQNDLSLEVVVAIHLFNEVDFNIDVKVSNN